jgi:hypothetical protein
LGFRGWLFALSAIILWAERGAFVRRWDENGRWDNVIVWDACLKQIGRKNSASPGIRTRHSSDDLNSHNRRPNATAAGSGKEYAVKTKLMH